MLRAKRSLQNVSLKVREVFVQFQGHGVPCGLSVIIVGKSPADVLSDGPTEIEILFYKYSYFGQPLQIRCKIRLLLRFFMETPPSLMVEPLDLKCAGSLNMGRFLVSAQRRRSLDRESFSQMRTISPSSIVKFSSYRLAVSPGSSRIMLLNSSLCPSNWMIELV